jgi:acetyl-CoA carboxylase biotin carboxyl carrier protein
MSDERQAGQPGAAGPAGLDPAGRLAAHAEIARLADDLLPALVARLGASGLGELEVREGGWRIRLRMPSGRRPEPAPVARRGGRAGSHAGGPARPAGSAASATAGAGFVIGTDPELEAATGGGAGGEPGTAADAGGPTRADRAPSRIVATSPAVGFYRPRSGLAAGSRVRAGERLGVVDVLGVPQEVLAPAHGLLGAALVEAGEPVEYGQEIVVVEPAADRAAAAGPAGAVATAEVAP